jgi:hypothetical protein
MELLNVNDSEKMNHAYKLAATLSKSSIVPSQFRNKPDDVFATLILGAELGFQPMQSLNSIVMIQGSATLKAQTMLAIAKARLPDLQIKVVTATNSVTVSGKRHTSDIEFTSVWDDVRAGAMGLLGKDNYKRQKLNMYKWRGISDVIRTICPDVIMGLYSTEEMTDVEQSKDVETQVYDASQIDLVEYVARERNEHPDWFEIGGNNYKFQNGKLRGKQMHEIDRDELDSYHAKLEQREEKSELKNWETEVKQSIETYLERIETQKIE